ncbi:hypothetical protein TNCV_4522451 [Trichonephila clavipes]|nr:hypothetical protein TNCV_4522451 [Trichonephila clavipes]
MHVKSVVAQSAHVGVVRKFGEWIMNEGILTSHYSTTRGGLGSRVVKVSDRGWPYHEFEPSTTKDPPCRDAMHVKSVRAQTSSSKCGVVVRRRCTSLLTTSSVSSSSLDHGSKLRGPSPKALV